MDMLTNITYFVPFDQAKHGRRLVRQRRHIHDIQQDFDEIWQFYLDLGAKFFLNLPWTVFGETFAESMGEDVEDAADQLRMVFDVEYDALVVFDVLINLSRSRSRTIEAEKSVRKEDMKDVRKRIRVLSWDVKEETEYMRGLAEYYTDVLAGANAALTAGTLPRDQWASERSQAFSQWAKIVQKFCDTRDNLEDFCEYAVQYGWEPEDEDSEDDENGEGDDAGDYSTGLWW